MSFVRVVQKCLSIKSFSTISGLFSCWHSLEQRVNYVPKESFTENRFWLIFHKTSFLFLFSTSLFHPTEGKKLIHCE